METKKQILTQVITFLIITTIITSILFIWIFTRSERNNGLYALMMFVPGISAIITTLLFKDKFRYFGWGIGVIRFQGYAYILPIIVAMIAYGLMWTGGITEFYSDEVINYKWARIIGFELPVSIVVGVLSKALIGFFIIFLLVTGEEIGWSGFLTQKLLKITSIPITSIVVGLYWSVWHFAAIIGGLYSSYYDAPLWIKLSGLTLVLTSASFLRTVLLSKSKSLWLGSVLHASHNVFLMGVFFDLTEKKGYAGYIVSETGIFTGIVYITIAIIFWKIQSKKPVSVTIKTNDRK
jgi:uncharacterized protein